MEGLVDDLPAFANEPPWKLLSWAPSSPLSSVEKALAHATARLKKGGLIRGHIVCMWVERRVFPLHGRDLPLSQYAGARDPAQVSEVHLSPKDVDVYLG